MIETLEVHNFKSIKDLKLNCKRFNIFIGEPNTGKSNILEALGVLSFGYYGRDYADLSGFVRHEGASSLFNDGDTNRVVTTALNGLAFELRLDRENFRWTWQGESARIAQGSGGQDDLTVTRFGNPDTDRLSRLKFYRFFAQRVFPRQESEFLLPPSGENLLALLRRIDELKNLANEPFARFGLRLGLRPHERKIELVKALEPVIISYAYWLSSDTLQRLIFHLIAIRSNKESILVFEEPEAHSFPADVNYLAETIALDDRGNQYFIATHNPYFLLPLLAKAPKEDVGIFITYYKDHQTKVKLLSERQMAEILEIDVFSNIDRYV